MKNLIMTLVLTAAFSLGLAAQTAHMNLNSNNYESLRTGIKSENTGLKKSAIYLAGKYELTEMTETLIEELKNISEPSTKILIALALYRIGDPEGIEAIDSVSKSDDNSEVRRMTTAILQQAEFDKTYETVSR